MIVGRGCIGGCQGKCADVKKEALRLAIEVSMIGKRQYPSRIEYSERISSQMSFFKGVAKKRNAGCIANSIRTYSWYIGGEVDIPSGVVSHYANTIEYFIGKR